MKKIFLFMLIGSFAFAKAKEAKKIAFEYNTNTSYCQSSHDATKYNLKEITNASHFLHEIANTSVIRPISNVCGSYSSCPEFSQKAKLIIESNKKWIATEKALPVPKEIEALKKVIFDQIEAAQLLEEVLLQAYEQKNFDLFKTTKISGVDASKCESIINKLKTEKDIKEKDELLLFKLPNCMNQQTEIPAEIISKTWKTITLKEKCEGNEESNE